jgi:alginate O-acetyltransferase complex protein AlgI
MWHGAKWTFIAWGLLHGAFLVLERLGVMRRVTSTPVLRHVYVLGFVMFAWIFFRSDSFAYAIGFLGALVRPGGSPSLVLANVVDHETLFAFAIGCVLATPVLAKRLDPARMPAPSLRGFAIAGVPTVLAFLFVASVAKLAAGTYNPFIYFRF